MEDTRLNQETSAAEAVPAEETAAPKRKYTRRSTTGKTGKRTSKKISQKSEKTNRR